MNLIFEPTAVAGLAKKVNAISATTALLAQAPFASHLSGAYSAIPQLQALAGAHSVALQGGLGSAFKVLTSFGKQVGWLARGLAATTGALTDQNTFVARGVDIADEGGAVGHSATAFPTRPPTNYGAFPFLLAPGTLNCTLEQMAAAFAATDDSAVASAVTAWSNLATKVTAVATDLQAVAGELLATNSGLPFTRAASRIREIANQGQIFAGNATAMAGYVGQIQAIKSTHYPMVTAAVAQAQAITEPEARLAFEAAELAKLNTSLTAAMPLATPPFAELMTFHENVGHMGSVATTGMDAIGRQAKSAVNKVAPMAAEGMLTRGVSGSTGSLAQVSQQVTSSAVVGMDEVATRAASAGGVATAQPVQAVSGLQAVPQAAAQQVGATVSSAITPGALGGQAPLGGSALSGLGRSTGTAGSAGMVGLPSADARARSLSMHPAGSARSGVLGTPALGSGRTAGSAMTNTVPRLGAVAGSGLFGGVAGGAIGAGGAGLRGVFGGASGVSGLGAGGVSSGRIGAGLHSGSGQLGSLPGGAGVGAGTGGASGASASGAGAAGRGAGPMLCAPGAGQGKKEGKAGKVQSVVTAVERDVNMRALVGERPPVVPGTIGEWAREPA